MPEMTDEQIQQMKDALEYCGWGFKWDDKNEIVFDCPSSNPNLPPVGTRYDYGMYETGRDKIAFRNWKNVKDLIDKAIYHSVEQVADESAKNFTEKDSGVRLNGLWLEEAMYPERFNGNYNQPEFTVVYYPHANGKWADATEIDLRDAHFSGNIMTYEGVEYDLSKTYFYSSEHMALRSLSEDCTKRDKRLINARLQIDGETGRPYYASMGKEQEFPPCCFAVDPDTHKLVMIQAGEKGTYGTPIQSTNAVDNQVLANKLNARYGVTKDQASEMLYCAKNGWDKETRDAWAEQKDNITPEQAKINEGVKKAESILVSGEENTRDGNISWELNKNGTLTISGTGWFWGYNEGQYPWSEYRDAIKNVVIEDGVQNVPNYAFENCHNLKDVEFPSSIKQIDMLAFANTGLEGPLILPENAFIRLCAFKGCEGIDIVYGKGNVLDDMAISDCGVKEIRLDSCTLLGDAIYKNYELTKVVSKNSKFEENSISYNLNLEDVVTEKDQGIETALRDNGYIEPKITAIDSNDKEKQGGKYNVGKLKLSDRFSFLAKKNRDRGGKDTPSKETQIGKSQTKTGHAME